ncbi:MAG TPA: dihydrodipicolinate synthase family protein [Burkholderiales bacterium]|nr:dihydrodipicolinate synthase family protein [Burkholderiales bacterium]
MGHLSYHGVLPAMQVPFKPDYSIDEPELRRFTSWLAGTRGITGLVTNGHTGEVFALNAEERAEVTRIVADEVEGRLPVVSGICVEGIDEACAHAEMAKRAGASGLLVMPPHQWLRFGMKPEHVVEHFTAIGKASGLDLVVHVYPSWTRAAYSCELLAQLARLPWVKVFKVGTRDMNKYVMDIKAIREAAPEKTILTCHDEYLLASMVQGVDGALVGFASFIPQKIVALWEAVQAGDLKRAMGIQFDINPLKQAVYGFGEPTGEAHARMKMAMFLAGLMSSPVVRRPTNQPAGADLEAIRHALAGAGMLQKQAA